MITKRIQARDGKDTNGICWNSQFDTTTDRENVSDDDGQQQQRS